MEKLTSYTGAGDEIRVAISNPSNEEAQSTAMNAVSQRVLILKSFFQFAHDLGGLTFYRYFAGRNTVTN